MSMTPTALQGQSSAKGLLTAMLTPYGLEALARPAYDLLTAGVTDPAALVLSLEGTAEFQARFPGMRDPSTKQLIMTPAEYISYERQARSMFADLGIRQPTQAEIGSFIGQRKSVNELKIEGDAYNQLRNEPFIAHHFEALLGQNPGPEGLFALLTGQAPDLEKRYSQAVANGIDPNEYANRVSALGGGTHSAEDIMGALTASPNFPFDAGQPFVNNFDKITALNRAVAANKAQFQAGGSSILPFGTKALTTTF